ncbi:uncharacterized protein LOC135294557 isoform X1 [Passer domesticus]|uniref:uncharacterized protein LOC135294557 isoform X1 n=1 Tax=Passer domesticus TaxID=48849 RepID=UPI0030FED355
MTVTAHPVLLAHQEAGCFLPAVLLAPLEKEKAAKQRLSTIIQPPFCAVCDVSAGALFATRRPIIAGTYLSMPVSQLFQTWEVGLDFLVRPVIRAKGNTTSDYMLGSPPQPYPNHLWIGRIRASLRKQNRVYFSYQLNLQQCSQPYSKDIPVKLALVKNSYWVWGWCPQMHVCGGFLKYQSLQSKVYQILSRMGTAPFKILDWFPRLYFGLELCPFQLP